MKTVYLDNSATSFPKPKRVSSALLKCVNEFCANPGRSAHTLSFMASDAVYKAREEVGSILCNAPPENICFTQNATHALNIAIKGLVNHKCHCIISDVEHNALLRPLLKLCHTLGVSYSVYNSDLSPEESIPPLIENDTEFILTSIASNVTGRVIDINALSRISRKYGLCLILDASQYIGHLPFTLSAGEYDALCAPGHKALFGIPGSGFLAFGSKIKADTLIEGGAGTDSKSTEMPELLPERFEAGTLSTPAIVTLSEGIRFLHDYGEENVEKKLRFLTEEAKIRISSLSKIKILGAENGILCFNVNGVGSETVGRALDGHGICVRAGLHCAPMAHKKMGTENGGAVRASFSVFNNIKDVDALYKALRYFVK